jgi:integrase
MATKQKWPFIRWAEKEKAWKVDARTKDGGQRRFFPTRQEAEGWAQAQRIRRQNHGAHIFDDRELAQYGWNAADAIRFALEHLRKQSLSVALKKAVDALIEAKRGAGRSERYCNDLRRRLSRLCAAFEGKTVAQIGTAELEGFLGSLNVAAATRNSYRRNVHTLWSFAEKRGWATAATAAHTERAKAVDEPPGILTPEQTAALLAESKDDDLLAYHAIGCFAGLRVAEIVRLDWRDVDLAGGFIHVSAAKSKTRSRRLVPISDNLRAWLQPIAKTAGPVVERELRYRHEAARKRAGIHLWPENCLRHSFVSYRLAVTQNAPQTALESGHDQAVLFRHYRELVRPKDAARFFAIMPEGEALGKVVAIAS